jgi:hypothetical protein
LDSSTTTTLAATAGVSHLIRVLLTTVVAAATAAPNLQLVWLAMNSLPVTVTTVAPLVGPRLGEIADMVSAAAAR